MELGARQPQDDTGSLHSLVGGLVTAEHFFLVK